MSDSKRYINSKFSRFEPEVDDIIIDRGWEKIKYFLPQEKKRRGFFFFRKGFLISALALVSTFFVSITILIHHKRENVPVKRTLESMPLGKITDIHPNTPNVNNTFSNPKRTPQSNIQSAGGNITGKINTVPEEISRSGNETTATSASTSSKEVFLVTADSILSPIKSVSTQASQVLHITPEKQEMDSFDHLTLEPIVIKKLDLLMDTEEVCTVLNIIDRPGRSNLAYLKKIHLEVFGGPNFTRTDINYINADFKTSKHQINFSIGLGLVYQFHRKWSLNTHIGLSENKIDYIEETSGNKIIDRDLYPFLGTTSVPDSIIRYKKINSQNEIRSRISYQINTGIVYSLFERRRITIGTSLQLSIMKSLYKFSSQNREEQDTLSYIFKAFSNTLGNVIQPAESYNKSYATICLGIVPGVICSYAMTPKLLLIFRPSYFSQLTKNTISPEGKKFDLKQSRLFIDLGLRIKL